MLNALMATVNTDYTMISNLIGSLGFPIAACCYMAFINHKQAEMHKEEMNKMTDAVNELKIAITSLVDNLTR